MNYNDYKEIAKSVNECDDCSVRALSAVSGKDYLYVRAYLAQLGRKPRDGTYAHQESALLKAHGLQRVCVREQFPARTTRTLVRQLPDTGKYLIQTSGHIAAYVDGQLLDWSAGRLLRIRHVWQVVPLTPGVNNGS